MRIGDAIISGTQLTLGTIYNATTNPLAGLTQVSLTNLLVSNLFIAGTALGGIALVKRAYNLTAKSPSLLNEGSRDPKYQLKFLAKRAGLATAGIFLLALSAYELSSTLSHLHDAGSHFYWCRSIKENYDSKYNAIRYFIGNQYGCYQQFRKEDISAVVKARNQYNSAGCVDKLGHIRSHSSLENPCYF